MKLKSLSRSRVATPHLHHLSALLGCALLSIAPLAARGQSVSFVGAQSTVPVAGLTYAYSIATDSASNLFIPDNGRLVEVPHTATGYGTQITLATSTTYVGTSAIATNSAGDVFYIDGNTNDVQKLQKTASGFGAPVALSVSLPDALSIAVDSDGNIFAANSPFEAEGSLIEVPKTPTGYGSPVTLLTGYPISVAVDAAGNVFEGDLQSDLVVELPRATTGFGSPVTITTTAMPEAIAVSPGGNLFVINYQNILELPKTPAGFGPAITLPTTGLSLAQGIAADSAGNTFLNDEFANKRVVEFQTDAVNFGDINVCASGQTTPAPCSETLTFNYSVTTGGTLGTPKVLTGGAPNLDFTLASGSTCTGALTAGTACVVNVTFAPLTEGVRNGSVEITNGGGNALTTTLVSGVGEPGAAGPPVAEVSPSVLNFATIAYGSSETLPLTVTNTGGGTLTLRPSFNGASYKLTSSTCASGLTHGNSCTLEVEFAPASAKSHTDLLNLETNTSTPTIVHVNGIATGVSANSVSLDFSLVPIGSSAVLPITFTNTAPSGTVTIATSISGPSFTVLTTAQNTCQSGLQAGHSCILPIKFAPVVVGHHDDFLTVRPSADGPASSAISLSGTGIGVGAEIETPLNFGTIPKGTSVILSLTIYNVYSNNHNRATLNTSINGNSFKVLTTAQNTCLSGVPPVGSCTLPVEFSPTSVGAHNEILTLTPSGSAPSQVHLDGIASAP